jgi:hypothetical protein
MRYDRRVRDEGGLRHRERKRKGEVIEEEAA